MAEDWRIGPNPLPSPNKSDDGKEIGNLIPLASVSIEELIRACAEINDGAAWEELVARLHRPISLSILRVAYQWGAIPQQVVDDLVQDTLLKLCAGKCRLVRDFALLHPHAVLGYIKAIAVNVAHDYFRSLHSQKRHSGENAQLVHSVDSQAPSDSLAGQHAIEQTILLKQLDRWLDKCLGVDDRERDRLIFWLYYRQGMSPKAIAAVPTVGLTAKGVESVIFRLTRAIREQVAGTRSQASLSSQPGEKGFRRAQSY
jgi:RNA polymerase sigma-70 factor (ECF subfamily)